MNTRTSKIFCSIRSVDDLVAAIGSGAKFDYLFFWGHKGSGVGPHVLSQWYPAEFREHENVFKSAEHYMMYRKALLFDDRQIAEQILVDDNPGKVKALGRKIRRFEESVWRENRVEIVVKGNILKFGDNPLLLDYLVSSKSRILVEASPRDKVWGIGLDAKDDLAANPFKWKGRNLLGFALMEARDWLSKRAV